MQCRHRERLVYTSPVSGDVHHCSKFNARCVATDEHLNAIRLGLIAPHYSCQSCPHFAAGKKLTIGMATYRDWPGVWATIQSIRTNHQEALNDIEFVVVDNDPDGDPNGGEESHSGKCRRLVEHVGGIYDRFIKVQGTAAAKGRIFELATLPTVLVMDCHVLLPSLTLAWLIKFASDNPDSKDLWQGPCIGDGGVDDIIGSHFDTRWGSLMYGQWAIDQRVHGDDPFEIPMQGCGLFACHRAAWPGFHPLLRGFGPEEWHIQQRIRRNGGKALCLPFLKWCHRFGNPSGATVPGLAPEERLRGHLITWMDTGNNDQEWFLECKRHFLSSGMTEKLFAETVIKTRREFGAHTVGDKLAEILHECGIPDTKCQACRDWRQKMNHWGADVCDTDKRTAIVARLDHEAANSSWMDFIRVAGAGYLSTAAILDEAIKRARGK